MKRWTGAWLCMAVILGCGGSEAREPVLGGPCEGCEWVFVGMPEQIPASARIAPATQPGRPLVIEGTVRDLEGASVAGVIVYAYHTDSGGIYPRGDVRHGRLRGWAKSDQDGGYRFVTIRPGAYPGGSEPQHVHMHVIEPGRGTYPIADINFEDDPLLTVEFKQRSRGHGGSGICTPRQDSAGVWHVRRDIVLGFKVPGYGSAAPR